MSRFIIRIVIIAVFINSYLLLLYLLKVVETKYENIKCEEDIELSYKSGIVARYSS